MIGRSAYFRAFDAFRTNRTLLAEMHVYTVQELPNTVADCNVDILWSGDGGRVMLTIDGGPTPCLILSRSRATAARITQGLLNCLRKRGNPTITNGLRTLVAYFNLRVVRYRARCSAHD
jgi:uncharacterized protein DUF2251